MCLFPSHLVHNVKSYKELKAKSLRIWCYEDNSLEIHDINHKKLKNKKYMYIYKKLKI